MTATQPSESIERQLGETMADLRHIREQIDAMAGKIDQIQQGLEEVKIEQATNRGARKAADAIRALVSAAIGAAASLLTIWFMFRGGN